MSLLFDQEKIHESNKSIIKEKGQLGEEGINKYEEYRKQLEESASVTDFIPTLVFSRLREEYKDRIGG